MRSELDHTNVAQGAVALAEPPVELVEDDSATAVAEPATEPATDVNWHLSPGYSTHLHAYELAMLPGNSPRSNG